MDPVMQMYAIYDLLAGEIVGKTVLLFPSAPPARRMFQDAMQDPKAGFSKHPEDYCLVYLGCVRLDSLDVMDTGRNNGLSVRVGTPAVVVTAREVLQDASA